MKSPAKPDVGELPPVGKFSVTGLAEPIPAISVPLFDPALSVANPWPSPLKLPRNSEDGAWPTAYVLIAVVWSLKNPLPTLGKI